MKNPVNSIIFAVVPTALIVGSTSYLMFNKSVDEEECFQTY